MTQGPRYRVAFRRRRSEQTHSGRRLKLLLSRTTRMVVRRSNRAILVQFVDFDPKGDLVRATATSRELAPFGWDHSRASTPAAYLTSFLAAQRAKASGVSQAVLDAGLAIPIAGGNVFAALKGAVDAGVEIPHGKDIFPNEDRLSGKHLSEVPMEKFQQTLAQIRGGKTQ